jgi:hypothetical protein
LVGPPRPPAADVAGPGSGADHPDMVGPPRPPGQLLGRLPFQAGSTPELAALICR